VLQIAARMLDDAAGIKRNAWLRCYTYDFIETFAPQLPRSIVERAVKSGAGPDFQI